jgi:hypothetical protein
MGLQIPAIFSHSVLLTSVEHADTASIPTIPNKAIIIRKIDPHISHLFLFTSSFLKKRFTIFSSALANGKNPGNEE